MFFFLFVFFWGGGFLFVSSFQLYFNFFNYQPWQQILSVTIWNADWFLRVYVEFVCVCVCVCIFFIDVNNATLDLMLWYDYM